ncbi:MAG: 4-hydroxy-3-methylbut-2-enyl diphosphate reductase [Lentisphaerae bacterium]|nr:4-hydroxy-3-methylbut-2-enyl diphosphate reductase [Lentisphaerota bacterium]
MATPHKTVVLVSPCGFCAGVRHAVEIAEAALRLRPLPLYALNEIVHNRQVVESFERRGVSFVTTIDEVPEGRAVLFSAHGVPPAVRAAAVARRLEVIDATCPFVLKVHVEVLRFAREGYSIVIVGHRTHDEVIGVAGEAPDRVTVVETVAEAEAFAPTDPARVAVVTQTTLSAEEAGRMLAVLRRRFPSLRAPATDDICYATTNRQQAVKALARRVGMILVLGAQNSSNTRRLAEVARDAGAEAVLVSRIEDIAAAGIANRMEVGVTAGASTPASFMTQVLEHLAAEGFDRTEHIETVSENIHFNLPRALLAVADRPAGVSARPPLPIA